MLLVQFVRRFAATWQQFRRSVRAPFPTGRAKMSTTRPRRPVPDDRTLLFGGRASGAPAPSGVGAGEAEALQQRNGAAVDSLRDRVGDMRHLALNIGAEVGEQNKVLDGMGGTFDGAGDTLGETMRALRRLSRDGAGGHMCVLFAFAGMFFFLVYLLLK